MRIAITANGPGEFAGWVRPLVAALRARDPATEIHVLGVPDDFATGREAAYVEALFPGVRAYPPAAYLRLALGRAVEGLPAQVDRVQYLGGDLGHAARVHARLGGDRDRVQVLAQALRRHLRARLRGRRRQPRAAAGLGHAARAHPHHRQPGHRRRAGRGGRRATATRPATPRATA